MGIFPNRVTRQPQGAALLDPNWRARRLKFAFLPGAGYLNLADGHGSTQSTAVNARGASTSGLTYEGLSRAEFPVSIDASKGLTIISIWRAASGSNYFSGVSELDLVSTRTSGNQGWSWGRSGAIGGGTTGNLIPQALTFQGVAQYIEANSTIEAFVDTPVACRYDPVAGKISWFRFGAKSSPDTSASSPSLGGNLVFGAQGDFSSNGQAWIDRSAGVIVFEAALSDAEINRLTSSTRAVWQAFQLPQRSLLVDVASGSTDTPINPGAGTLTLTGYAPSVTQSANQSLTPGAGSVAITGYAPTISQPQAITAVAGTVTITGYAPTVTQAAGQTITPGTGALTLTGYAPVLAQTANQFIVPASGTVAITGYSPTITQASSSPNITPDVGNIAIAGYAPIVMQSGGAGRYRKKFQIETSRGVLEAETLDEVADIVRTEKRTPKAIPVEVKLDGFKVSTPSLKPKLDYKAIEEKLRAQIQAEIDEEEELLMMLL